MSNLTAIEGEELLCLLYLSEQYEKVKKTKKAKKEAHLQEAQCTGR